MVEISDRIRSARNARGISGCDDFYSQGRYKGLTFLLREAWPDIQHDSPDDTESYPTPTTAAPMSGNRIAWSVPGALGNPAIRPVTKDMKFRRFIKRIPISLDVLGLEKRSPAVI